MYLSICRSTAYTSTLGLQSRAKALTVGQAKTLAVASSQLALPFISSVVRLWLLPQNEVQLIPRCTGSQGFNISAPGTAFWPQANKREQGASWNPLKIQQPRMRRRPVPPHPSAMMSALASISTSSAGHGKVKEGEAEVAAVMEQLEQALGTPFSQSPIAPEEEGLVIVISGPSGVGKDAVIRRLQRARPSLHFVVTATSRPKRPGEQHGRDYLFMTTQQFEKMIQEDELLEFALVYGQYKGIPKQQVKTALAKKTDVVLRLDVQGAATLRSLLGGAGVFIFLTAESEAALVKRLVSRKTEPLDSLAVRVGTARRELAQLKDFDYVVENREGRIDDTVAALCSIIDAEKLRVGRPKAEL